MWNIEFKWKVRVCKFLHDDFTLLRLLYKFFFKIQAKIIYCWEEKKLKPQVIWKTCEPINYLCLDKFAVKTKEKVCN